MKGSGLRHTQADVDDRIADFYRDHSDRVLAWVIRLGGPRLDAVDVAQDVFVVALRRYPDFRDEASLSTWLYAITRRVVANARRRAALRRFVGLDSLPEPPDPRPGSDEQADQQRRRRWVQDALEQLPAAQREVIALIELEGLSAPEAAALIGVPVGTVYSRLHVARRRLQTVLTRRGITAESLGFAHPEAS